MPRRIRRMVRVSVEPCTAARLALCENELLTSMNESMMINCDIDPSAMTVTIEFLDGPTIPTLTREQAYALLETLQGALPHMAVKID
jgi:hypothetical protein